MRDSATGGQWDFTPVYDLIHSFAGPSHDADQYRTYKIAHVGATASLPNTLNGNGASLNPSLGDFDSVWKSIGYLDCLSNHEDLAKGVRWRDEIDGADLADNDEHGDNDWLTGLTKQQRKKVRRRARRAALVAQPSNGKVAGFANGTDDEEPEEPRTPDRKALIHELLERPLPSNGEVNGHIKVLKRPKTESKADLPVAKPRAALQRAKEENTLAVAAAKKVKITEMLKERFIEERQYLEGSPLLEQSGDGALSKDQEGLHIFIDASNIMIGFHDALKLARSLPLVTRIRRQQISFHSLSLILSRGRPSAKRVVVGSDKFPEMEEAKLLGYETSILERVHKAKELTPRQKRFRNRENGTTSAGSGSETTAAAAQFAPEKWVEQAVDEILHLKMMESLVDAAEPAIMVLATGDAAEAEFSGGFLKMVERALSKGWKVELACWKHNMSAAYKKKDFRHKWGKSFRIIELDDFAELLSSVA